MEIHTNHVDCIGGYTRCEVDQSDSVQFKIMMRSLEVNMLEIIGM